MHSNPVALATSPPKWNTHTHTCTHKQVKAKHRKTSHHGTCAMSQCVPQYTPLSTHLHLQMFIAMTPWSGMRPLASATLSVLEPRWNSSHVPYCCPVSWRFYSFGTAHTLQWFIDGVHVGVNQLKILDQVVSWSIWQLLCDPTTLASSTSCLDKVQGPVSWVWGMWPPVLL